MDEGYMIMVAPIITLGIVYSISGFELAVLMGLGMLIGTEANNA